MSRFARPLAAYPVFLGTSATSVFCFTLVVTVNLLYQATVVGLDPLQLILVGTALEGTYFVANVPFGVVADLVSRRRSVIAGLAVTGCGWTLEGAVPAFWAVLAGSVLFGIGAAMEDGAMEAWAADAMHDRDITSVFLRGGQAGALGTLAGVPSSVALGLVDLRLAIVAGGMGFVALAAVLAVVMPERPRPPAAGGAPPGATAAFRAALRVVRGSGVLVALIAAVGVAGAFSEGFDRLSTPHLLQVGLPHAGHLRPVVWFGILAGVGAVIALGMSELLRRATFGSERRRTRALGLVWAGTVATVGLFALAPTFVLAASAMLLARPLRALAGPLWTGWMSDHTDPAARATVLSFAAQADCLGQVTFGPAVGVVAVAVSVPAALLVSAVMLVPSILFVSLAGRPARNLAGEAAT